MIPKLITFLSLINSAAALVSDPEVPNPEYDRALVEMIMDNAGLGLTDEDKPTIEKILRAVAE